MADGRWRTADGRRPSGIGHRGASGIAYENSPSAFRLAKQLGADGVELDVHATGDGVLIVHHDYAIAEAGLISGLSSTDIAHHRLPNGEEIPTLAQALDPAHQAQFVPEFKLSPQAAAKSADGPKLG